MAKKTITKEHPITTFRKANEARQTLVKTSMKKMQTGGPTADSTEIYTKRLNTFTKNTGGNLPVKQRSNKDTDKQYKMVTDVQRQRNKGQAGYDKNGFPIKKK
jgi:hypothetical protein